LRWEPSRTPDSKVNRVVVTAVSIAGIASKRSNRSAEPGNNRRTVPLSAISRSTVAFGAVLMTVPAAKLLPAISGCGWRFSGEEHVALPFIE